MKKMQAEKTLEELLEVDSLGIAASMTDEQIEAVRVAFRALKCPESLTCGYCQRFADETVKGDGWCKQHGRLAQCDDPACCHYE